MPVNLREEKRLWKMGFQRVACLDESGRGPLAGPVVAVAVVINSKFKIKNTKLQFKIQNLQIKDSKKLTPRRREKFYKILTNHPQIEWGIARVSEKVIDKINILEATKLAMARAVKKLRIKPDFLILDGNFKIDSNIPQKSIVKADEKVLSCALASILAKVYRDKIMQQYHKKFPQYGFNRHKGYPTKLHLRMLKKYDPCKIHRMSFRPVKINSKS